MLKGGLENVPGYSFAALKCGIKKKDRLDYCIITSERPCNAAGMFTTNKIFAAPVKLCKERINNPINAILINAMNANACTGKVGYDNTLLLTDEVARQMNILPETILMASTGVIGHQLPIEKMKNAIPELIKSLSPKNADLIPAAIMTTDTVPKSLALSFKTSQGEYRIAGTVKGSGMIAPNMATLLSFIITDCPVEKQTLNSIFRRCIEKTMNSITIDGDMSTNDTAIVLLPILDKNINSKNDLEIFENALECLLFQLSEMLVMDGEGTTKMVKVKVTEAKTDDDARKVARSISESLLVKTAFFGKDPNWGRIACAAGNSGAEISEETLTICIEDIVLFKNGIPQKFDLKKMEDVLSNKTFTLYVNLGQGESETHYITSDISYEYVRINAEYTT